MPRDADTLTRAEEQALARAKRKLDAEPGDGAGSARRRPARLSRRSPAGRGARREGGRSDAVDAVRGLALWGVLTVLAAGGAEELPLLLRPVAGDGFGPVDLVPPALLVVSGAGMAWSLSDRTPGERVLRMLRRVALLVAAAVGLAWLATGAVAFEGTLATFAAATLGAWVVWSLPARWFQITTVLALLAGQWWLLTTSLPRMGLVLPTMTATLVIGYWTGAWLRQRPAGPATATASALSGLYVGGVGIAVAQVVPVNRLLWTPSYVLVGAGTALLALAVVHLVAEVLPLGWLLRPATTSGRAAFPMYLAVATLTTSLGAGAPHTPWGRMLAGFRGTFGHDPGTVVVAVGVAYGAFRLGRLLDARGWVLRA